MTITSLSDVEILVPVWDRKKCIINLLPRYKAKQYNLSAGTRLYALYLGLRIKVHFAHLIPRYKVLYLGITYTLVMDNRNAF